MIIDSVKEIFANFREALLPLLSNPIREVEQSCLKYSNLPWNQIAFPSHDVCPAVVDFYSTQFRSLSTLFSNSLTHSLTHSLQLLSPDWRVWVFLTSVESNCFSKQWRLPSCLFLFSILIISFSFFLFFYSNLPLAFYPCHVVCPADDFNWDGDDDKGGFTGMSMIPSRLSLTRVGIYLLSSCYIGNIYHIYCRNLSLHKLNTERKFFIIQTSFSRELGFGIWLKVVLKFDIFLKVYGLACSPPRWSPGPFAYQVQVCKLQTVENSVHMIITKEF